MHYSTIGTIPLGHSTLHACMHAQAILGQALHSLCMHACPLGHCTLRACMHARWGVQKAMASLIHALEASNLTLPAGPGTAHCMYACPLGHCTLRAPARPLHTACVHASPPGHCTLHAAFMLARWATAHWCTFYLALHSPTTYLTGTGGHLARWPEDELPLTDREP